MWMACSTRKSGTSYPHRMTAASKASTWCLIPRSPASSLGSETGPHCAWRSPVSPSLPRVGNRPRGLPGRACSISCSRRAPAEPRSLNSSAGYNTRSRRKSPERALMNTGAWSSKHGRGRFVWSAEMSFRLKSERVLPTRRTRYGPSKKTCEQGCSGELGVMPPLRTERRDDCFEGDDLMVTHYSKDEQVALDAKGEGGNKGGATSKTSNGNLPPHKVSAGKPYKTEGIRLKTLPRIGFCTENRAFRKEKRREEKKQ